jgi:hypothetical protein
VHVGSQFPQVPRALEFSGLKLRKYCNISHIRPVEDAEPSVKIAGGTVSGAFAG